MSSALLISVTPLHDQYHGEGDYPPSPFRLFQALIAGAYSGRWRREVVDRKDAAFRWLERLPAPVIAGASPVGQLQAATVYVPNNDMDSPKVKFDPKLVGKIRDSKTVSPLLLAEGTSYLYAWMVPDKDGNREHAEEIARLADRLSHLGRGVDPAFARGCVVSVIDAEEQLVRTGGVKRPTSDGGTSSSGIRCPMPGSLDALEDGFQERRTMFSITSADDEGGSRVCIRQPRKRSCFATVAYNESPAHLLFDLTASDGGGGFAAFPVSKSPALVALVRDLALQRLKVDLGAGEENRAEGLLKGRKDASAVEMKQRIRLIPLPSIGHRHADGAIRRILVEVPPTCPIDPMVISDVFQAIDLNVDPVTGEALAGSRGTLTPADSRTMLRHYGIASPADMEEMGGCWRTVTPAALPTHRVRGRASGWQRSQNEGEAITSVRVALRHIGYGADAIRSIVVQREPWTANGLDAGAFADGGRFSADGLWHVEIIFTKPVHGPMLIGNGRFMGLGLMAPQPPDEVPDGVDAALFDLVESDAGKRPAMARREHVLEAVRRALMSLARDAGPEASLLFSGHDGTPDPARGGTHRHVFLSATGSPQAIRRIQITAPWAADRSFVPTDDLKRAFLAVVGRLRMVKAGEDGVLTLRPAGTDEHRRVTDAATIWKSVSPYKPTRHLRSPNASTKNDDEQRLKELNHVLKDDISLECARRGLPAPTKVSCEGWPSRDVVNGGLEIKNLTIEFRCPVAGPIILGRTGHHGGGLFRPQRRQSA